MANLVLGSQVLLLDGLEPSQREALVQALAPIEAEYTAHAALQHSEPQVELGHCSPLTWLQQQQEEDKREKEEAVYLSYLGLHLGVGHEVGRGFGGFEPSFTAVRNLSRVLVARDTGHAINLVGPPGVGKSAVAEVAARLLGRPFTRISCSRSLTAEDLFGSYRPTLDPTSGQVLFLWCIQDALPLQGWYRFPAC